MQAPRVLPALPFSVGGSMNIRSSAAWRYLAYLIHRIIDDDIKVHASHLAYTTLLSLIPVVTVFFSTLSISPALSGSKGAVQSFIFRNFAPDSGLSKVIEKSVMEFSNNASNVTIIGLLSLLVVVLLLVSGIDQSINKIWKCKVKRPIMTSFMVYWTTITLGPILIGCSFAVTSYIFSLNFVNHFGMLSSIKQLVLKFLPLIFSFIGLSLLFLTVPRRKVRIIFGLIGGLFSAVLLEIVKMGFSYYLMFASYEKIYGAIAAIPVLLIWIYTCWYVVILGVEFQASLQEFWEAETAKGKGDSAAAERIAAEVAEKGEISEDEALEQEIKERAEAAVEKICGHDAGKDSAAEENACKKAPDGQQSDAPLAEDGKATDGSTVSECPSANKGKES